MNIVPIMITCGGREAVLAKTLESWRRTDFGCDPLIQVDTGGGDRRGRQTRNSFQALGRAFFVPDVDFILFMEDDLEFNPHLKANLVSWAPLTDSLLSLEKRFFGSLYNPNIRELSVHDDYFVADPDAVYGSQCFILSRSMAEEIVRRWHRYEGMQDIRMSRIAGRDSSIYYHRPSLVQHVGATSTWGGHFHQCADFSESFLRS